MEKGLSREEIIKYASENSTLKLGDNPRIDFEQNEYTNDITGEKSFDVYAQVYSVRGKLVITTYSSFKTQEQSDAYYAEMTK